MERHVARLHSNTMSGLHKGLERAWVLLSMVLEVMTCGQIAMIVHRELGSLVLGRAHLRTGQLRERTRKGQETGGGRKRFLCRLPHPR